MLQLHTQFVSASLIGETHGLQLPQAFKEYAETMKQAVQDLYAQKDTVGGWRKWLNLGYNDSLFAEMEAFGKQTQGQYTDLVILGIGGSSLGGFALLKALLHPYWNNLPDTKRNGRPRYHFIENVDSDQIQGLLDILDAKTTLVNVITKSGTTAETMSAFLTFKNWLETQLGSDEAKKRIVATTDQNKGILRQIANEEGYQTFEVPDDVGGRFSIFSAVGLLPASVCGVNIRELQRGIQEMDAILKQADLERNPAAQNTLIQYLLYQKGKPISVFMPYSYRLAPVSDWYVQLWAESLGKKESLSGQVVHVGPTPVRAVGVTDQHSQVQLYNEGPFDKVLTFIQVEQTDHTLTIPNAFPQSDDLAYLGNKTFHQLLTAEFESTRASLTRNNRPHVTLSLPKVDAYHFAQLLYFLEVQTALAGSLFNIDPFNQPGVELAKVYTNALMGRPGFEHLVAEARGEALTLSK